jgi:hypothetical protein
MSEASPHAAIEFIFRESPLFAKAKSDRVYLEEFRKCKKALLMSQSAEKSAVAREQYAYSHAEYLELLEGLRTAIEIEETLRWRLTAAQARVEIWRTESANNRRMDRAAQ